MSVVVVVVFGIFGIFDVPNIKFQLTTAHKILHLQTTTAKKKKTYNDEMSSSTCLSGINDTD